jgi:hypothetical protein
MNEFLQALGPFAWGFAVGYFWYPLWQLGKRIVEEARLARQEWRNPNANRND